MGSIISFPSQRDREWQTYSEAVIEALRHSNESEKLIQFVLERMRVVFDEFQFDYPLDFNLPEDEAKSVLYQINNFSRALQFHHSKLIQSRLEVEVELARAQGF